jgi:hypothetical protein
MMFLTGSSLDLLDVSWSLRNKDSEPCLNIFECDLKAAATFRDRKMVSLKLLNLFS